MLFIFDQRNLKRTKYNTAITYKSSPSFCTFYTVFTLFLSIFSHTFLFFFVFRFSSKGKNRGVFGVA